MPLANDTPLFAAIRNIAGPLNQRQVQMIKAALIASDHFDPLPVPATRATGRYDMSEKGIQHLKDSEQFRSNAYPDPGSRDGTPWTVGYGATGSGIRKGTVWTELQAAEWLIAYVRNLEDQIEKMIGNTPTTQDQFDALVHFGYNIGTSGLRNSTLLKKHLAKEHEATALQFRRWVFNDGKKMAGLVNRRNLEERMYRGLV